MVDDVNLGTNEQGRPLLSTARIKRYGAGGFSMYEGQAQGGCPAQYRAHYETYKTYATARSEPLIYGGTIHDALHAMENDDIGPEQALEKVWPAELPIERLREATDDLNKYMERGGPMVRYGTMATETRLEAPLYEDEDFGWVYFMGIIDWLGVDVDQLGTLHVVDYKAGFTIPKREDVLNDIQLLGYEFLVRANWSQLGMPGEPDVVCHLDAIKWRDLEVKFSAQQIEDWQIWASAIARRILRDEEGAPRVNPGCGWCLPPGEQVLTTRGFMGIEEITSGMQVVSHDGLAQDVLATTHRTTTGGLIAMESYGSPPILLTPEHPVCAGPDRHWIPAGDLTGEEVVWARIPPDGTERRDPKWMSLLGWYLAEGCADDRTIRISLGAHEHDHIQEVQDLLQEVCSLGSRVMVSPTGTSVQVVAHSRWWAEEFRYLAGVHAEGKRIPSWLGGDRRPLLRALFRGDGSMSTNGRQISYCSVSKELTAGVQVLLLRLGIVPTWQHRPPIPGHASVNVLTISGPRVDKLAEIIGWTPRKPGWFQRPKGGITDDGWVWYRLSHVEAVDYEGPVHDLVVRESHSFQLPGLVGVHNCEVKLDCKAFRKLPGRGLGYLEKRTVAHLDKLVPWRDQAKETVKHLTAAIKEVDGALAERVALDGYFRIGDVEYYEDRSWSDVVDRRELAEVLGDAYYLLAQPTKTALDQWLKVQGDEQLTKAVKACFERQPTGTTIKKRKVEDDPSPAVP